MENKNNILEVRNLNVSYTNRNKKIKHVLKNISFNLEKGEILGLAGESGSGKSTIAKAILGMTPKDSGKIEMNIKRAGMIFQDPFSSLNPAWKVGKLLEEPLLLSGIKNSRKRREKVYDIIKCAELDEALLDRKPEELSGGQRQRVSIAMALVSDADFLIADEPVSALDVTIQSQIVDLLIRLRDERNLSILFISHDLRTMYNICDRIMIMHDGVICESGEPKTLYRAPQDEYTKKLLSGAGIM